MTEYELLNLYAKLFNDPAENVKAVDLLVADVGIAAARLDYDALRLHALHADMLVANFRDEADGSNCRNGPFLRAETGFVVRTTLAVITAVAQNAEFAAKAVRTESDEQACLALAKLHRVRATAVIDTVGAALLDSAIREVELIKTDVDTRRKVYEFSVHETIGTTV